MSARPRRSAVRLEGGHAGPTLQRVTHFRPHAYMRIDIITVLPEMIEPFVSTSIVGRAQREGFAEVHKAVR